MLAIFRTNSTTANIFILLYLILLRIPVFTFPKSWNPTNGGILTQWFYQWFGYNSFLLHAITTLLIFFTAVLLNEVAYQHKLGRNSNLFPGLIYCIVSSLIPDFLLPAGLHFANLFLILAISETLGTYRKNNCEDKIFNIGLLVAMASLFSFSYSIFVFIGIVGLNAMRAIKINEIIIMTSGFLVPYILLGTSMFWFDSFNDLIHIQILANIGSSQFIDLKPLSLLWSLIGIFTVFLGICFLAYPSLTNRKNMQEQKKIDILYWILFLAGIGLFLQADVAFNQFLIFAVPLGMLLAFLLTTLSNTLSEVIHLVIFIGIILFQYKDFLIG